MKTVKELLQPMEAVLADIPGAIGAQKAQGKKIVGVFPIYAPEELVHNALPHYVRTVQKSTLVGNIEF